VFKRRPKTTANKPVGKGIVGLTDDAMKAKRHHRNPLGWTQEGPFLSERAARDWQRYYLDQGYVAATEEDGWRFGYRYPIAESLGD
jgi:hypothetical protein